MYIFFEREMFGYSVISQVVCIREVEMVGGLAIPVNTASQAMYVLSRPDKMTTCSNKPSRHSVEQFGS